MNLIAAALAAPLAPGAALAQAKTHKVAIHVDDSDPQRIGLALRRSKTASRR